MNTVTELLHTKRLIGEPEWAPLGQPIFVRSIHLEHTGELSINRDSEGRLHWLWVVGKKVGSGIFAGGPLTLVFGGVYLIVNPRAIDNNKALIEFGKPAGRDIEILLPGEFSRFEQALSGEVCHG